VVGGVWTAVRHPILTLVIVIALIAVILWTLPRLYRLFRRQIQRLKEAVRP
jgi:protein-S-isoprenylcysteine O-methyltransferase Ste14